MTSSLQVVVDQDQELSSLQDLSQKIESSLIPSIEEYVSNDEFQYDRDGLDFLEVKNSILLSYMIELTLHARNQLKDNHNSSGNLRRLTELKIVLDKMRPLEKRMRYSIDKLLSMGTSTDAFASTNEQEEDPLNFKPDPAAMQDDEEEPTTTKYQSSDNEDDDDDEEIKAAKQTLSASSSKKTNRDDVYQPRHLMAVPYNEEHESQKLETERIKRRKARATEFAQLMRHEYGDAPEQDDIHGGTEFGKQREAAKRLAQKEAERRAFEEDAMVRLSTSRKDKKLKQKIMRDEGSNLRAIADLGNLVRGVNDAFGSKSEERSSLANEPPQRKRKNEPKNSLQKALFGTDGKKKKKKHRK